MKKREKWKKDTSLIPEMFCDSYNQARGSTATKFSAKAYSENSTYGYRYRPAHVESSINSDGYGTYTDNSRYEITAATASGMYRPGNNENTWLASPSTYSTNRVCYVSRERSLEILWRW